MSAVIPIFDVEYEHPLPGDTGSACDTKHAWARVPVEPSPDERAALKERIKRVLKPDLDATCSLDLGCPVDEFSAFCDQHPDRTVVVYANTSAAVKARSDWLVTSSCALDIARALKDKGHKILWAPDKHLGSY